MNDLQLKVKHFFQLSPEGEIIKETGFVDGKCGCAIEQAASEQMKLPINEIDEGIMWLYIRKMSGELVLRYNHEAYTNHMFYDIDQVAARQHLKDPEFVIRTIKLTPHEST